MSTVTAILPRTPAAEKAALEDLIASEGWAIFRAAMDAKCSPTAYQAEVAAVLEEAAPEVDVAGVVRQITATYSGLRQMLVWPDEQIRLLSGAPKAKPADRFALFRRIAR